MTLNSVLLYSRNNHSVIKSVKPILGKYISELEWDEDNVSILDIGIGDGRMTKEVLIPSFPKKIKELIGCDISESALQHSRSVINSPLFETLKMDIATTVLPDQLKNKFNYVFSVFCLHNVKNSW